MTRHKTFLFIWLALFVVSSCFCVKSALSWRKSALRLRTMEDTVLCDFTIDLAKQGTTTAQFKHSLANPPHGAMLFIESAGESFQGKAAALEKAEVYISIANSEAELLKPTRLFAGFHLQDISTVLSGNSFTAFTQLNKLNETGDYEITIDVRKAMPEGPAFHVIAQYTYCGIESIRVFLAGTIAAGFGLLSLLLLCCAAWRLRKLMQKTPQPTGSKVMYLLSVYPRWSETFLRLDMRYLEAEGIPLHIISLFPGNCEMQEGWPSATVLSPYAGWGTEKAWKNSTPSDRTSWPIPKFIRARISLFKHRQLLTAIITECKQNGIGHIHAEFADLAALLGAKAAKTCGCTFSVGIHALDIHNMKYPPRTIFGNADFITVCNQSAAIAFSQNCPWAKERLHIIHHGIDLPAWPFQPQHEIADPIQILFCGRLVPKKGISILIDAMKVLIAHAHHQAKLTIVGEGPLENDLKDQCSALNLNDAVVFTGRLDQEQIRQHFATASCLCAPSIVTDDGDRDGVPNIIVEAMAFGLPVIGSLSGSLQEVITDDTAWPVAEPTAASLADAILDMASQQSETERRRTNARNLIEYRFDAAKLAKKRAMLFNP